MVEMVNTVLSGGYSVVYLCTLVCFCLYSVITPVNGSTFHESTTQFTTTSEQSCFRNGATSAIYTFNKSTSYFTIHPASRYSIKWTVAEGPAGPTAHKWLSSNKSESYIYLDAKSSRTSYNSSASFSVHLSPSASTVCVLIHYATTGTEKHVIFLYNTNKSGQSPTANDQPIGAFRDLSTGGHWSNASLSLCVTGDTYLAFQSWQPRSNSTIALAYIAISVSEEQCPSESSASATKTQTSSRETINHASLSANETIFGMDSSSRTAARVPATDFTSAQAKSFIANKETIVPSNSPNSESTRIPKNTEVITSISQTTKELATTRDPTVNPLISKMETTTETIATDGQTTKEKSSFTALATTAVESASETSESAVLTNSNTDTTFVNITRKISSSETNSFTTSATTLVSASPSRSVQSTPEAADVSESTTIEAAIHTSSTSTSETATATKPHTPEPTTSSRSTEQSLPASVYTAGHQTSSTALQNISQSSASTLRTSASPNNSPTSLNSTDDAVSGSSTGTDDGATVAIVVVVSVLGVIIIIVVIVCLLRRRPSHKGNYITDDVFVTNNVSVGGFSMHSINDNV